MTSMQENPTDPLLRFSGYLTRRASIAVMNRLGEELSAFFAAGMFSIAVVADQSGLDRLIRSATPSAIPGSSA